MLTSILFVGAGSVRATCADERSCDGSMPINGVDHIIECISA